MAPIRTLVVDDEDRICLYLKDTLQRVDHVVTTVSDGQQALDLLRDSYFDLIMLDLRLGGNVDGIRILEAVRWRWPETAVVILTAHGTLESAVAAIEHEVDGFLLKPVEPKQVRQAVVDALDRRRKMTQTVTAGRKEGLLQKGPFSIDRDAHKATQDGQELQLTPQEFDLLVYLIENAPRVISPPELVQVVRDYEPDSMYEARQIIKWYIHRLRRKVEPDPSNPTFITNVRGVGYGFADE